MSAVPKKKMTAVEYLANDRAADFKSQFYNGEMFAMAGASLRHGIINENLSRHIGNALDGSGCKTLSRDMRVFVPTTGLYTYPDLLIVCGPPVLVPDEHFDILLNPKVIVEILSPSTESFDRRKKFRHYQTIPTLMEYVLVAQDEPHIERYVRADGGRPWEPTTFADIAGEFVLTSVPVKVRLADIYRDVDFDADDLVTEPAS